jgi:hypothetical protein
VVYDQSTFALWLRTGPESISDITNETRASTTNIYAIGGKIKEETPCFLSAREQFLYFVDGGVYR